MSNHSNRKSDVVGVNEHSGRIKSKTKILIYNQLTLLFIGLLTAEIRRQISIITIIAERNQSLGNVCDLLSYCFMSQAFT